MSGIVYPSGPQTLAIPTTILLPSTSTPFNPSAINPSVEACWDAIKALQSYGFFKATFDAATPPYPAGGLYVNAGMYKFSGIFQFTTTGVGALAFDVAHAYARSANLIAHYDDAIWEFLYGAPINAKYRGQSFSSTSPITFEFCLPDGITLEQVTVRVEPAPHAALPATKPRVYVWMTDNSLGTNTLLTPEVIDSSPTFGDYNVPHNITVNLPSTAFGAWKNTVVVEVYGESGANAEIGLVVCIPIMEFNRTRIAEELGELLP